MDGAASNSSASVYLLSPPVLITIFYTARFASCAAFAFHSDTYRSSAAMLMVRTNEPMVLFLHHTRGALSAVKKTHHVLLGNFVTTDLTDQLIGKGRYTSYSWANHPLSFSHLHSLSLSARACDDAQSLYERSIAHALSTRSLIFLEDSL